MWATARVPSYHWLALFGLAFASGCSGAAFSSRDEPCDGKACGGGGSSSGAGGASKGGTSSGHRAGAGGSSAGGSAFPTTPVLDDFERAGPALGEDWIGATDAFSIMNGRLGCDSCADVAIWSEPYGAGMEVFATLASFDQAAREINLALRVQGSVNCEMIEIVYSPEQLSLRVAYCLKGVWKDLPAEQLLLKAGDRLGARIGEDDQLQVFVNGAVVQERDLSAYTHKLGRIGVNGVSGPNGLSWDDFGGGPWP